MNLTTITNIPSSNWKRVTTHSVSAVAGVALAISAVVAFSSSISGPTSVAPSREASVPALTREATYETIQDYAGREQTVLDTLSSPLQQASVADIDAERAALVTLQDQFMVGQMHPAVPQSVSSAASDAERAALVTLQEQFMVGQMHPTVPPEIAASVLSTELANYPAPVASAKTSDAHVLASTLGGEMATYDVGATPPVQRQASAADIDASVRSTEQALYGVPVEQRKAAETDISASVLSTELANFETPAAAEAFGVEVFD